MRPCGSAVRSTMTSSNGHIFRVTGLLGGEFHRSPVNSPHKGQWRGALMFSLICAWTVSWANNGDAGDLRRYRAHYDVIVMHLRRHMASDFLVTIGSGNGLSSVRRQTKSAYKDTRSTLFLSRWCHQMDTFSALLAICAGNSPVPSEFPTQRPVTRSFDVFFDLRLNKRLSKQWRGWWFETLSRPLWRHRNVVRGVYCEYFVDRQLCFNGTAHVFH